MDNKRSIVPKTEERRPQRERKRVRPSFVSANGPGPSWGCGTKNRITYNDDDIKILFSARTLPLKVASLSGAEADQSQKKYY
eukprot:scaffold3821_cov173-Amphora_coffeaeformis.AAC.18